MSDPTGNALRASAQPMTDTAAATERLAYPWLPLKYEDGEDFCTVTDNHGNSFALSVQPNRIQKMEEALCERDQLLSDLSSSKAEVERMEIECRKLRTLLSNLLNGRSGCRPAARAALNKGA